MAHLLAGDELEHEVQFGAYRQQLVGRDKHATFRDVLGETSEIFTGFSAPNEFSPVLFSPPCENKKMKKMGMGGSTPSIEA